MGLLVPALVLLSAAYWVSELQEMNIPEVVRGLQGCTEVDAYFSLLGEIQGMTEKNRGTLTAKATRLAIGQVALAIAFLGNVP